MKNLIDWHVPLSEPVQNLPNVAQEEQELPPEEYSVLNNPASCIVHYLNDYPINGENWNSLQRDGITSIEFVLDNTGKRATLKGKWFGRRQEHTIVQYISVLEDLPFGELDRMWPGTIWHKGV